ncbi:hypothetical protein M427DRAFT_339430 [Gonapodya prolifera JEL478]|uniref:Uncharacterized protein n=1 Tax=Gonapodya prolifera (strain JEL478) TaxID=1344416 RepID=A0A139ACU9_GONPJ|nr:hypothetical protein M427DRAFT_339430 [Gonapodya prolifera JEL478]|eukprot:KXS14590.1 hypothetical protein M427DRAFT_339430 [Gonapodya prolifera JEL478]
MESTVRPPPWAYLPERSSIPPTWPSNTSRQKTTSTKVDLLGTTEYTSSNQLHGSSDSNSSAGKGEGGWRKKARKFVIGKGRWSVAFVVWTIIAVTVEISLVSWRLALSIRCKVFEFAPLPSHF